MRSVVVDYGCKLKSILPELTIPDTVSITVGTTDKNKGNCPPPYFHVTSIDGDEAFIKSGTAMVLLAHEPEHMHLTSYNRGQLTQIMQECVRLISRLRVV